MTNRTWQFEFKICIQNPKSPITLKKQTTNQNKKMGNETYNNKIERIILKAID